MSYWERTYWRFYWQPISKIIYHQHQTFCLFCWRSKKVTLGKKAFCSRSLHEHKFSSNWFCFHLSFTSHNRKSKTFILTFADTSFQIRSQNLYNHILFIVLSKDVLIFKYVLEIMLAFDQKVAARSLSILSGTWG